MGIILKMKKFMRQVLYDFYVNLSKSMSSVGDKDY